MALRLPETSQNVLEMSGALQPGDATTYPESKRLKEAKKRKRKEMEKTEKNLAAEEKRTLRNRPKQNDGAVDEAISEWAKRRQSRGQSNDSVVSLTGKTTQTARTTIAKGIMGTINSVLGMKRTVSTRFQSKPRQPATMDGANDDSSPPQSPDQGSASLAYASTSKSQATPTSLSLANFRRRPRQPSILRMVQQSIADGDDLLINSPNLEAADDSILAGLQHSPPSHEPGATREPSIHSDASSSASRKRKAAVLAEPLSSSPSSHAAESEHLPSDPAELNRDSPSPTPPVAAADDDARSRQRTRNSPGVRSVNRTLIGRRSMPQRISSTQTTATSPLSTPPLSSPKQVESESQPSPVAKRTKHSTKEKPITTAILQALLPRRRQPPRQKYHGAFDIPSDDTITTADGGGEDEDDDVDELQRPARRRVKSKKNRAHASRRAKTKVKTRLPMGKNSTNATDASARKAVSSNMKATRTYGRPSEDKENVDDMSGTSEDEDANNVDKDMEIVKATGVRKGAPSKELVDAKEKFKAVDDWELEFESCDVTGGSSSPWR